MKTVWKWVLGILIAVVVIVVVAGAGAMIARRAGVFALARANRLSQNGNFGRNLPQQGAPQQGEPQQGAPQRGLPQRGAPFQGDQDQRMPRYYGQGNMPRYAYNGMGYRPFGGLLLLGRLLGGALKLALLGLVIFLAVTLALRPKKSKQPEPVVAAAVMTCPHCTQEVQAGWKHCPNCGNSLEPEPPAPPEPPSTDPQASA
jgi:hypothetical protein